MATGEAGAVGRLFDAGGGPGHSDRQWVDRFVATRDERAFAAIVERHGPMVLGVCRSLLAHPPDADDAFQATFLVLARRAGSLRDRDGLSPWLHGVARRVSLRARAVAARRRGRERPDLDRLAEIPARPGPAAEARELAALLHAELDRLSPPERSAVLLCDVEGRSHQEAADQLGWPLGTVKSRVLRGRERLRTRLVRRGVALSAPALVAALAAEAGAGAVVARPLALATARLAVAVAAGRAVAIGLVPPSVASLTQGVARTMILNKLTALALGLVAATSAAVVPGVVAQPGASSRPGARPQPSTPAGPRAPILVARAAPAAAPSPTTPSPEPAQFGGMAQGGVPQSAAPDEVKKRLDGPSDLKKLFLNALAANTSGMMGGISRTTFRDLTNQLGGQAQSPDAPPKAIRSVYSDEATQVARSRSMDPDSVLGAPAGLTLRAALESAAAAADLKFRVIDGDLFFEPIAPAPARVAVAQQAPVKAPASVAPAFTAPAAATVAGPATARPRADEEARNLAILKKLEEPNPLKERLARFYGGSPTASLPAPSFAEVMDIVTEATVDPAAGLPKGIPIRLTAVGKRLASRPMMGNTVDGFVAGPPTTPLRVVLASEAARYGLDYRVADGELVLDETRVSSPGQGEIRPDVRQRTAEDDRRNEAIRAKLDRVVPLRFPNKVSLNGLIAHIKDATRDGNEKPIPVYIDPRIFAQPDSDDNGGGGGRPMRAGPIVQPDEPAITIDLDDVPLRTSLRLALLQLRLQYAISGGLLVIGSATPANPQNMGGGMGGVGQFPAGINDLLEPRDRTFGGGFR